LYQLSPYLVEYHQYRNVPAPVFAVYANSETLPTKVAGMNKGITQVNPGGTNHYLPLDGLRGIAIFLVFWHHYELPYSASSWTWLRWTWLGWTGVDLFFVLSGFLITGILFDTLHNPNFFRIFYIRRALRIFPLYFSYWIAVGIILACVHFPWNPALWAWVFYVGNYLTIHAVHLGLSYGYYTNITFPPLANGFRPQLIFGHFWSLCVEEQYYLIWPMVVFWLKDRRRLIYACIAGIALTIVLRFAMEAFISPGLQQSDFIFKFTFARTDSLLMGGWLALALRGPKGLQGIRPRAIYFGGCVSLVLLIFAGAKHNFMVERSVDQPWLSTYGLSLIAVVATALLVAALQASWLKRLLIWRPLLELGRISYGFYILHFLPFGLIHIKIINYTSRKEILVLYIVFFAMVWVASWISYRWLERPFLRLKDRWAPQHENPVRL
jgi:peptidoglycan/LPS O-acetylase OafA/YrhL